MVAGDNDATLGPFHRGLRVAGQDLAFDLGGHTHFKNLGRRLGESPRKLPNFHKEQEGSFLRICFLKTNEGTKSVAMYFKIAISESSYLWATHLQLQTDNGVAHLLNVNQSLSWTVNHPLFSLRSFEETGPIISMNLPFQ